MGLTMDKVDALMAVEGLSRWGGRKGVENLCRLCRLLGYKDSTYFGQFAGGSIGDLIEFLEDNPGAVEAVVDFIRENEAAYDLPEVGEEPD